MGFALVCVLMVSQSMNLGDIVLGQKSSVAVRLYFIRFPDVRGVLYLSVAETNRAPLTWPKVSLKL